jgi:hypothetical protein
MGVWPFAAFVLVDLAELAAEMEQAALSEEVATQLERCAAETGCDLYRGLAAMGAAWADLSAGATHGATRRADEAVGFLSSTGCRAFQGRAADLLGRCLSEDDSDRAVESLERAVTLFESCGAVWRRGRAIEALRDLSPEPERVLATVLFTDSSMRRRRRPSSATRVGASS